MDMLGNVLCPFCFNKVHSSKIQYMCINKNCDNAINKTPIAGVKPDKYGVCNCEKCKRPTSAKICPKCQHSLPQDILKGQTRIVSIVGGAGSGKSYFVATLLRQIMEKALLAQYNTIATRWVTGSGSDKEYARRFKSNLDSGRILEATQKKTNLIEDNPPLLVELSQLRRRLFGAEQVTNTFSFFDAAGESFEDESDLAAITPYLRHSEAVILLLDPRQVEFLDQKISAVFPNLTKPSDKSYSDILHNVIDLLKRETKTPPNKQLDIPLCVAFSKWDLLLNTPDLLPEGLVIGKSGQTGSAFDINMVNTMSSELRSLLMTWSADLVHTAENNFKEVCYFAFSAWGTMETGGKGAPPIASFGVEDPFLWILNRNQIIQ